LILQNKKWRLKAQWFASSLLFEGALGKEIKINLNIFRVGISSCLREDCWITNGN
jgi:hypothetical protein